MPRMPRISLLLVVLFFYQCAPFRIQNMLEPPAEQLLPGSPEFNRTIQVQYLGAAGYMISRGSHAILPAPLYSNPSLFRVGFLPFKLCPFIFTTSSILIVLGSYI